MSRRLNPAQQELLDHIELAARSIRHALDCPGCFNKQLALSLEDVGLYCTLEVKMPGGRCVDLVVVSAVGNVAIECDGREPRSQTVAKFRDLAPEILRVLVMRHRKVAPVIPHCDRVVCLSLDLQGLRYLVDGKIPQPDEGLLLLSHRKPPRSAAEPRTLLHDSKAGREPR